MNSQLQFELNRLLVNFNKVDRTTGRAFRLLEPPNLTQIQDCSKSELIQAKIAEMLAGDAAARFYAAVLLNEVDKPRSQGILNELNKDTSIVKVQKQVGHGVLEVPAHILAAGFEREGKVWSSDVQKIENLSRWALAVEHERRQNDTASDARLPNYADVLAARNNADKMLQLKAEIEKLLTQSAAHKFYAAALLENINDAQRQSVLQSLKEDSSPVLILFGDIAQAVPASEIADSILENRSINIYNEEQLKNLDTPVDKFFRWLNSNIFKK